MCAAVYAHPSSTILDMWHACLPTLVCAAPKLVCAVHLLAGDWLRSWLLWCLVD
jgi:hypothetical protein